jgi:predicted phosphodiesterase
MPKKVYTSFDKDAGQIMHVVAADMKHERTISWKTSAVGEAGTLEIRAKQSQNITRWSAEARELPSYNGGKPFTLYTVHITGLAAGTVYEYRVSVGKQQSAWQEFKTEPESTSFRVLIFGDSQSVNYNDWASTAQAAWKNNKDAAFFINMGDLVDNGQDEAQWNAWFDGAASLLAAMPVVPVMGNHETYSLDWKMATPDYYLAFFALPMNGPEGLKQYVFAYDFGDVRFIVLNTQLNELQDWYADLIEVQKKWLEKELSQTQKKWKVVLMHRGIWEQPFTSVFEGIGKTFVPIFDKYQVDLVFTGHVHSYARTKALKNCRSNPCGTVYITTGHSGDIVWDKSSQNPLDDFYYNPLDMPNYLVLEATQDMLKITVFKQNGELIDQTEIKKQQ